MPDTITHIHENRNPDSLEIGTAGKGGVVKIYFDADKPDEAKARIKRALEIRTYAQLKLEGREDDNPAKPIPAEGST